jgi:hypothetical protein
MGLSSAFAPVRVWAAIALSYETNLPIGFFVGSMSAFAYTVGRAWVWWHTGRRPRPIRPAGVEAAPAAASVVSS